MIQITDHEAGESPDRPVVYEITTNSGDENELFDMLTDITSGYNIQIERL